MTGRGWGFRCDLRDHGGLDSSRHLHVARGGRLCKGGAISPGARIAYLPLFRHVGRAAVSLAYVPVYTIAISHYHTITLSHYHTITLSHYHTITLSHYHTIALSHYHTITLSHYHTITLSHYHTPLGRFSVVDISTAGILSLPKISRR